MSLKTSSIIRKVSMALSGLFLVVFLTQHFTINLTSVFSENIFNKISHFMGNNFVVQFILQPILIGGFLFHLIMGFVLDFKNRKSSPAKYAYSKNNNSTWVSRNMIITGFMIFSFICLHFYDFWIPEINTKFIKEIGRGYIMGNLDIMMSYSINFMIYGEFYFM